VRKFMVFMAFAISLSGCASATKNMAEVQDNSSDRVTVGKVEREIRIGMTNAQVAEVLGSPNVVTTDDNRNEVWVYDKVSTNNAYSTSKSGILSLILGTSSGASSSNQKTLTIIVKFNAQHKVRDFAYHMSSF
jgi:outer membrane protein assembly factor BamE (lipoprotein component of BamABCDE complex)